MGVVAVPAAASHGMENVIELLVEHGADLLATNARGRTPVETAVYREGIAGAALVRGSTVGQLREMDPDRDPAKPHTHPDAQELENATESSPESLAAAGAAYSTRPSNPTDDIWQHGGSEIITVIRDGIGPDFAMDPLGAPLADEEIWSVVNYVKSLNQR